MKRNMDLIRSLLLKLEALDLSPGEIAMLDPDGEELGVEGAGPDEIEHHLYLIDEAGFIDTAGGGTLDGLTFRKLTWEGYDFLDSVRDDRIWARTKQGASEAGGYTVELLKDLAKGFVRKQIEEKTGIRL